MALSYEQVAEIWKFCDTNKDGAITLGEFKHGFNEFLKSINKPTCDEDVLECMFKGLDAGLDGKKDKKITWEEMKRQLLDMEDRRVGMIKQFKKFAGADGDASSMTRDEFTKFVKASKCVDPSEVDKYVDYIFRVGDSDGSGKIEETEFVTIMDKMSAQK